MRSLNRLLLAGAVTSGFVPLAHADHPVFDLVANRPLAHLQRGGGLAIAAGTSSMARYVHFSRPTHTWTLGATEDGHKVALATTNANLEVPLTAEQAKRGGLVLFGKGVARQTVKATIAGKSGPAVPMGETFAAVSVPLPEGALVAGENRILLTFANAGKLGGQKAAAAVESIVIGAGPKVDAGMLTAGSKKGLAVPAGGGLAYYVYIPEGGTLATAGDAGGCALTASAVTHGGKHVGGELKIGTPLDLSPLAGDIVRLEIDAAAGCQGATLTAAALTHPGDAPKLDEKSRPRNIVFWMTDSTRADKFKVFNPKTRVETPVMDAFAKKATLFSSAYTQGNESRVSHASQWTGTYPSVHKFIPSNAVLPESFMTFPEIAKAAGEYVVGFMGNGYITARWGFGGGFDLLKNNIHDGGGLKAEDFVKTGSDWVAKNGAKPFFMYIGTIDAHVSWRAHSPWIEKYDEPGYVGPFVKSLSDPQLDQVLAGKIHMTERDKVRTKALYDSDISYNDHEFGELMKHLEADGRMKDTMIILSADHGDEFWDHGKIGHGQSLHEELVHTPLAIYYPPLFPAKIVTEGVETIDLLPTIADALGQKIPDAAQGESLIPLAQGIGAGYPRAACSSQYELAHAMRLDRFKLWVGGSGDTHFADVVADPLENKDLSKDRPFERRFVNDAMGLWMAYQSKWKKSKWGVASNLKPGFADDNDK
ncbi:MAG: sulfatase [Polyangia bacterium]